MTESFQDVDQRKSRARVLVVGPLFPKGGGVGMVNRVLLTSDLKNRFEMRHLDTGRGSAGAGKESTLAAVNFYYFFRQALRLLQILVFWRPRILHQSVTFGLALWKETLFMQTARLFGVKVVAHIHGSKFDVQLRQASSKERRMLRTALRVPHVLLVLSEYHRSLLHAEISPTLNVVVVPNSVDNAIADAMERKAARGSGQEFLVLFLGQVGTRKGVPDALRAVPLVRERVPEARFVFAGPVDEGPEGEMIRQACETAKRGGGVSFPGLVVGEEKLALLSAASVFILPSYHENLPVSILEAMAMGLPVVTTPVAGIAELVQDGQNGFLIQPGDHLALADRIVDLAADRELRARMGAANVSRVRRDYHPRVFSARIARLYDELLAGVLSGPDRLPNQASIMSAGEAGESKVVRGLK